MSVARLAAPMAAMALLAAHFGRAGQWPLTVACVALALLVPARRRWVPPLLQVALAAGCLEWIWSGALLVQQRVALGRPWLRLALVMSALAMFTAAAALVFRSPTVRARYLRMLPLAGAVALACLAIGHGSPAQGATPAPGATGLADDGAPREQAIPGRYACVSAGTCPCQSDDPLVVSVDGRWRLAAFSGTWNAQGDRVRFDGDGAAAGWGSASVGPGTLTFNDGAVAVTCWRPVFSTPGGEARPR